jgi:hypothetical protein
VRYPRGVFDRQLALQGEIYLLLSDQSPELWRARIDDVLGQFVQPRVDVWLRTEHLAEDFTRLIRRFRDPTDEQLQRVGTIYKNQGRPARRLWTEQECRQIYSACPRWAALEAELYGAGTAEGT